MENLNNNPLKFKQNIGFLHSNKNKKLLEAVNSYETYEWTIPDRKEEFIEFVKKQGRLRNDTKEVRFFSIIKDNLIKLNEKLTNYNINSKIYGP